MTAADTILYRKVKLPRDLTCFASVIWGNLSTECQQAVGPTVVAFLDALNPQSQQTVEMECQRLWTLLLTILDDN